MASPSRLAWQALLSQREVALPVDIHAADERLRLIQQLRFMPDRRAVFLAERSGGEQVVIKFYSSSRRSKKDFHAEVDALRVLQQKGVLAPSVCLADESDEGALLVLPYLGSESGKVCLDHISGSASDEAQLVASLVRFVGEMHRAGVVQNDIHLGNFLRHAQQWHLIDAGDVYLTDAPITGARAMNNLAWLLAQFPPLSLPSVDAVVDAYGAPLNKSLLVATLKSVRAKRFTKLVKKTQRDCSEFAVLAGEGFDGMARREYLNDVTRFIDAGIDASLATGELLKDGNSATVWKTQLGHLPVVVKRYNQKNWLKRLSRQLKSRARNSWINGAFLRWIGVESPQPIFYLRQVHCGVVGAEYLVCQSVDGELLPEICEKGEQGRNAALQELARFFVLMALLRFDHGDSKYTNFLFHQNTLHVIDLDGMERDAGRGLSASLSRQRERLFVRWQERDPLAGAARKAFDETYNKILNTVHDWL